MSTSDKSKQEPWRTNWKPLEEHPVKSGGHGTVRFVESLDGSTKGALKILKEEFVHEHRSRMRREVVALETLKGTNGIPAVLEHNTSYFEDASIRLYVVMQFIDEENLNEHFHSPTDLDKAV